MTCHFWNDMNILLWGELDL